MKSMNQKLMPILGVVLFAFTFLNGYGATSYVSSVSELKTALNSVSAGDIIYLRNGTYNNFDVTISKSGSSGNYIKILAENPGEVHGTGSCHIVISGSYIQIGGFSFSQVILHTGNLFDVNGNNNIVEDMYMYYLNSTDGAHRYIYLPKQAKNNVIRRCWFEKGTSQGISVFQYDNTTEAENTIVEECYFKGKRQVTTNGGETVRFGTSTSGPDYIGGNIVRNNLFDESDGEPEIISLKNSDNIIEGNTFTNSWGHVACRHMARNIIRHNFFITTESKDYTDCIAVRGRGHKIENNYFYGSKSKEGNEGGAITLHSGDGSNYSSSFETVRDVSVKDNIIVEPNEHAFALGARTKSYMPYDITFDGNLVYSNTDKAMIWYWKSTSGIVYTNNKIYKNVGISASGISNVNPNLQQDAYGVYRADGKGPSGNPLTKDDVGPLWMRSNNPIIPVSGVSVSPASKTLCVGETVNLDETVSPSNATNKTVTWSSNNTAIATVNSSGLVTAKAAGTAFITVETNDGNKTATSNITVQDCNNGLTNLALNKPATASDDDGNVAANAVDGNTSTRWSANGFPQWMEVDLGSLKSISRTEVVCYLDRAYKFTVEAKGKASDSYTQIVNRSANTTTGSVTSPITDNFSDFDARYVKLSVTGASGYTGTWASIVEFRVFGVDADTNIPVESVSLASSALELNEGESSTLTETVLPADATDKSVSWSTSNSSVATVSNGMVTAVSEGSATITVTTKDGNKTAICAVTVVRNNTETTIPGKIEAEDYDAMSGIQTESTSDVGGGTNVGWIDSGDWMDYEVDVQSAGIYTVDYRVAAKTNNIVFDLKNGSTVLCSVNSSSTGAWQTWKTVSATLTLSAGKQTLRVLATGSGWNINWMEFVSDNSDTQAPTTPTNLSASNLSQNGCDLSWSESTDNVGVTAYNVLQNGSFFATVTTTSISITGLSCAAGYSFTVKAKDAAGNVSTASSAETVTTSNCTSSDPVTVTLEPIHDAYLQGSTCYNNNIIRVESGNRVGYLMYDLSSIDGSITDAQLKLTCNSDAGSGNININLGTSNSWTESNLSSTNKPGTGVLLGNKDVTYSIGAVYTWELDATNLNGGSNTSFVITHTSGNDVAFASKENSVTGPELEVTSTPLKRANEEMEKTSGLSIVRAYPNPMNDVVTIDYGGAKVNQVTIFNMRGEVLYKNFPLENVSKRIISLDELGINAGVYFLHLVNDAEARTIKLIRQ